MAPDELPEEREVNALLANLDHRAPMVSVEDVLERARRGRSGRIRTAAGIVLALVVASGAAYAAPGSPLPRWLAELGRSLRPEPLVETPTGGSGAPAAADSSGIAVAVGDSLVIRFVDFVVGGYVRVEIGDEPDVFIRSPVRSTRFVSEPDRVLIEHTTPDTVVIRLPRTGDRLEIQVGSRRLLRRDDSGVTAAVDPDGVGAYLLSLGPDGA